MREASIPHESRAIRQDLKKGRSRTVAVEFVPRKKPPASK
jgi:hypothetical protein